jgi:hypothetical protein
MSRLVTNNLPRGIGTQSCCHSQHWRLAWSFSVSSSEWSPPAIAYEAKEAYMLYLTGILTVAALIYLAYVMIRPEKF